MSSGSNGISSSHVNAMEGKVVGSRPMGCMCNFLIIFFVKNSKDLQMAAQVFCDFIFQAPLIYALEFPVEVMAGAKVHLIAFKPWVASGKMTMHWA